MSPTQRARQRARALRARGDLDGARRTLEKALEGASDLERAALEADLTELATARAVLATRDQGDPAPDQEAAGDDGPDEDGLVGRSPAIAKVRALIRKAAASDAPLLVEGPSGSGKELVARAVHRRSKRAAAPFVALGAAGLSPGLVEDELFGHAAGAFTGAASAREGLVVAARGGTLLLDLVDDLSLEVQAKLLRVLEGGEARPLGGGEPVRLEARIIATTRRPLGPLVRAGELREDLLFRLSVLGISVPPLRERREDIPLLVRALLARHAKGPAPRVEPEALAKLVEHAWPGNVRELENELRRLLALGEDPIRVASLGPRVRAGQGAGPDLSTGLYERLRGRSLVDIERDAILAALRSCDGNRTAAAKVLKVSRRALYDKLRRLGLERS